MIDSFGNNLFNLSRYLDPSLMNCCVYDNYDDSSILIILLWHKYFVQLNYQELDQI
jgi:hypothetical protein